MARAESPSDESIQSAASEGEMPHRSSGKAEVGLQKEEPNRRLSSGTGRIGVLAGAPRRWRDRANGQAATALYRVWRTHRHLRHDHQESPGLGLTDILPSSLILQTSPAWVQHFIHHLAPGGAGTSGGMAGFVLANGSMSSDQSGEGDIRRALIKPELVDCMVSLPGQLFYSTQISEMFEIAA